MPNLTDATAGRHTRSGSLESLTVEDVSTLAARMTLPDEDVRKEAAAALEDLDGAAGRLGDIAIWLAATQGRWPPRHFEHPVLIVIGGGAPPAALLELATARVQIVPAGDAGSDAGAAFTRGTELAAGEVDGGTDVVLLAAGGDTVAATAATAVLTNQEVAAVVGNGPGMTDRDWMRVCAEVRDAARRARPHAGTMIDMLEALADPVLAMATGVAAEAAARRTAVVLDDVVAAAAGLAAQRISYRTARWFGAAQASPDPAFAAAVERLRLTPVVDYGLSGWPGHTGVGALLALTQLRATVAAFADHPAAR